MDDVFLRLELGLLEEMFGGYGGEMSHYIEVTDADYDLLREVDKLLSSQQ